MPDRNDAINDAVREQIGVDYEDLRERVRRGDLGGLDHNQVWEGLSSAGEGFDYDLSEGYSRDRGTEETDSEDSERLTGLLGEFEDKFGTPDSWNYGPVGDAENYDYDADMNDSGLSPGVQEVIASCGGDYPNARIELQGRTLMVSFPDDMLESEQDQVLDKLYGIARDYDDIDDIEIAGEQIDATVDEISRDFDSDMEPDIMTPRSSGLGQVSTSLVDSSAVPGDFDGDGKSDIMPDMMSRESFPSPMSRERIPDMMPSYNRDADMSDLGQVSTSLVDSSAVPGDFDGDGVSDVSGDDVSPQPDIGGMSPTENIPIDPSDPLVQSVQGEPASPIIDISGIPDRSPMMGGDIGSAIDDYKSDQYDMLSTPPYRKSIEYRGMPSTPAYRGRSGRGRMGY